MGRQTMRQQCPLARVARRMSATVSGQRLANAGGNTVVMAPSRGLSSYSIPGGPLADPEADRALLDALRGALPASVNYVEVDAGESSLPNTSFTTSRSPLSPVTTSTDPSLTSRPSTTRTSTVRTTQS